MAKTLNNTEINRLISLAQTLKGKIYVIQRDGGDKIDGMELNSAYDSIVKFINSAERKLK